MPRIKKKNTKKKKKKRKEKTRKKNKKYHDGAHVGGEGKVRRNKKMSGGCKGGLDNVSERPCSRGKTVERSLDCKGVVTCTRSTFRRRKSGGYSLSYQCTVGKIGQP